MSDDLSTPLSYAGAPVERPAMDADQFAFDNEREIKAALLTSPNVIAHTLMDLRDRVEILEELEKRSWPILASLQLKTYRLSLMQKLRAVLKM